VKGVAAALTVVLALGARAAAPHERSISYSSWTLGGGEATVRLRLSLLDLTRLGPLGREEEPGLASYLMRSLTLAAGSAACAPAPSSFRELAAEAGWLVREWRIRCPPDGPLRLRSDLLLDVAPSHLHFVRVRGGGLAAERVLSDAEREWALATDAPPAMRATVGEYLRLGVEHIVTGYDHLVFLLALLLLGSSLGEVARLVTGFTAGHSVTLGLAALGFVTPARSAVEALIGLSIALVAVENVWLAGERRDGRLPVGAVLAVLVAAALATRRGAIAPPALAGVALFAGCYFGLLARARRPAGLRAAVALLFGLVHGFAFAGVLAGLGLPRVRLLPALLGFNLGVEAGQLTAVAVAWPLLRMAFRRGEPWRLALVDYGSASALGVGIFWFVSRAFG
jgi:hypothetical protein